MAMTLDAIETEAMNLNTEDRAHLLDRLVSSLDSDAEVLAAWDLETDRRNEEIEAGTVQAMPLDTVLANLYAELN
jgi:putative addiction module component (TIGR02574 family)